MTQSLQERDLLPSKAERQGRHGKQSVVIRRKNDLMQTMVNHNRDRLITVTRRAQVFLVSKWLLPASSVGAAVATRLFRHVLLNEQGDPVQHSLVGRPSFQSAALLGPLIQVSTQFAHQRSLRGKVALIALVERSTSLNEMVFARMVAALRRCDLADQSNDLLFSIWVRTTDRLQHQVCLLATVLAC